MEKEIIKVMQHYENGGVIEFSDDNFKTTLGESNKEDDGVICWDWDTFDYRIKEVIVKYGRSITVHHKKRIQYKEGDILGNNITFIEEVEPETRLKSEDSNKLVNFRRAMFRCYCGKNFKYPTRIDLIKMQKVKSCGCLQPESVKKYHKYGR